MRYSKGQKTGWMEEIGSPTTKTVLGGVNIDAVSPQCSSQITTGYGGEAQLHRHSRLSVQNRVCCPAPQPTQTCPCGAALRRPVLNGERVINPCRGRNCERRMLAAYLGQAVCAVCARKRPVAPKGMSSVPIMLLTSWAPFAP